MLRGLKSWDSVIDPWSRKSYPLPSACAAERTGGIGTAPGAH
jgi:hypothetical protein